MGALPSGATPYDRSWTRNEGADTLGKAYAFDGPALELGALVLDGEAHPAARIRVRLSMLNRHGLVAGATGTISYLTSDEGKGELDQLGGLSAATAGVILRGLIGWRTRAATCSSASRSSTATSGSSVFRSFARSAASAAGREITRDLLGTAPCRTPAAGVAEPSGRGQGCQQV